MKNRKPQACCWCGYLLQAGEGNLCHVDEEDEDLGFGPFGATGWLVSCLDTVACHTRREEEKRLRKEAAEKKRAEDDEERRLFPRDGGEYVRATEKIRLEGEIYERPGKGHDIYGFGAWYYDTHDAIWHVENNGSDGADWGRNNILTGGAGAIGLRYERTPERLAWLARQENVSARWRRQQEEAETEKTRIREILKAAVERAGGWQNMEAMLQSQKTDRFCPRELAVNGKATRKFSIAEARRIVEE